MLARRQLFSYSALGGDGEASVSYLERAISADERIEHTAKTHWVVYILPVLFIPVYGIGLIFLFFAWLYTISTDLGVTNKRVIGKWGFISRRTIEQRLGSKLIN